ncbi:MAG: methylmalonyl-CoA carboxyltransferase [Thermoprotei archaeon]|nr:MAG: methylmalonyl-CoA carboxyltransferase [Thermoprotei archaeon]
MRHEIEKLREMREKLKEGGGLEKIVEQHKKGKLTARERIELLLDENSLVEFNEFVVHRCTLFGMDRRRALGDGVITGFGTIDGRPVLVYAQDFTFMGGSVGEMHAKKIAEVYRVALKIGVPVIGLIDSGGARIQEGVDSLKGYGEIFYLNVLASGVIPQISAIVGPAAGGAVYSPALQDFIFMVRDISYMFLTGPKVVKAALGETVTFQELGGADIHGSKSGVAHFVVDSEEELYTEIKRLLSYLPLNNMDDPPVVKSNDDPERREERLNNIIPSEPLEPYDIYEVIEGIFDLDSFLEVHKDFAPNAVVGFARLDGIPVGVVANQPKVYAGCLDIDSSDKISRFVMFCNAFNIPIVTLVDVPGFLPGTHQEHGGVIRHGAKIVYAYSIATVPKLTVILRKAYGGGYIAMCSSHLGADVVLAWPTAEIAVMGPEGAAEIVYKRELRKSEDRATLLEKLMKKYRDEIANPYVAAGRGYVNSIIEPSETRPTLIRLLKLLMNKRELMRRPPKKHGIPPL